MDGGTSHISKFPTSGVLLAAGPPRPWGTLSIRKGGRGARRGCDEDLEVTGAPVRKLTAPTLIALNLI